MHQVDISRRYHLMGVGGLYLRGLRLKLWFKVISFRPNKSLRVNGVFFTAFEDHCTAARGSDCVFLSSGWLYEIY